VRLARFAGAAISSILVVSSRVAAASIAVTDANTSSNANKDKTPMLLNTVAICPTLRLFFLLLFSDLCSNLFGA
jgi:hypothetical protein